MLNKVCEIKAGCYKHYKGGLYDVIGVANHTETGDPLVIYRALYGEYGLWARPYSMFCENIQLDGRTVPRFTFCEDS